MKKIILGALALALMQPVAVTAKPAPAPATAQERMIPMAGGRNFRDVGGYRTADGRTVRWNTLYRSGSLGSLKPEGMTRLQSLNVRAIIDLRMTAERRTDPSNWLPMAGMGYWTRDYQLGGDQASLARVFSDPSKLTADNVRAMMTRGYRTMPKELAPQYRELFSSLIG